MIPVDQEFTVGDSSGRPGDCLRACIASVLKHPRDQVPHFVEVDDWQTAAGQYVIAHGYDLAMVQPPRFGLFRSSVAAIAIGKSPRKGLHAVVVDPHTGELLHDPHPSRDGLSMPPISLLILTPSVDSL